MKDILQDIVAHTHSLGFLSLVKVTSENGATTIDAMAEDRSVILTSSTHKAVNEFTGTFGMPNLDKLSLHLKNPEYKDNAKIEVVSAKDGVPSAIHFETKAGDFVNDYRLMAKAVVEDKVKEVKFKGAKWDVEFEPTVAGIMRLKKQAQANSEEANFTTKTDKGDLRIYFGDASNHSGNFVFQPDVKGTLSRAWQWPVKVFLAIMDLPGEKTVRISDQGAAEITVESGLATYRYLLPAQSK